MSLIVALSLVVFLAWYTLILPARILRIHEDIFRNSSQWVSAYHTTILGLIHALPAKVPAEPKDSITKPSGPDIITK